MSVAYPETTNQLTDEVTSALVRRCWRYDLAAVAGIRRQPEPRP